MTTKAGPKRPRKSDGYPDYVKEILDRYEAFLFESERRTISRAWGYYSMSWSKPPLDAARIAMLLDLIDEDQERLGPGQYGYAAISVSISKNNHYHVRITRSRFFRTGTDLSGRPVWEKR